MKITTRGIGGGYIAVALSEGSTVIDLGFNSPSECADLAVEFRSAADDLSPQPASRCDELVDALDEALEVIRTLNGKDNSCDESYDVSDLEAVLARAKAAA